MNLSLNLRSLEPDDINFLLKIENDESLWKYSNTTKPYSREVLQTHIENSKKDFFSAKQQRFVLNDFESNIYGLIDLFDYDHQNSRAAIGIVIESKWRRNGFAKSGLKLLQKHAVEQFNLSLLYAYVGIDNIPSRALFKAVGFQEKLITDKILVQKTINA